jgi:polyhydroxyalkanoate synthesis regulator phasin
MGKIVVEGTTFNIAGNEPTEIESQRIQEFFQNRNKEADIKSGLPAVDQNIEDVLSNGLQIEDKDADNFVASPEFGRLVTEVLLSIGGSVAATFVPGGQVALPLMTARVARYALPLIKAAKTAIGAGVGGGAGAAISQTFDPKEDIVKEITRAAAEGSVGDVLGRGAGTVLSKIYGKVVGKGASKIKEADIAQEVLKREKEEIAKTLKARSAGQGIDEFSQQRLARLQDELGPEFADRVAKSVITPDIATTSFIKGALGNIAEGSFTGGGALLSSKEAAKAGIRSGFDDYVERTAAASFPKAAGVDPTSQRGMDLLGELLKKSITQQDDSFKAAARAAYQSIDDKLIKTLGDANVVDTKPIKALAEGRIAKLKKQGVLDSDAAIQTYRRAMTLPDKTTFADINEFRKTINEIARTPNQELPYYQITAKNVMKDAVDELTLGKNFSNKPSPFKTYLNEIKQTGQVTKKFDGTIGKIKGLTPEIQDDLIKTNTFYKKGIGNFNDEVITKIVEKNPDKVYQFIVAGGKNRTIPDQLFKKIDDIYAGDTVTLPGGQTVKGSAALAEKTKDLVRGQYFIDMLTKARKGAVNDQITDAASLKKFLNNTESTREILFGKQANQISQRLQRYEKALATAEGKFAQQGLPGKMFIQLKQAAQIGQLPAALGIGYYGGDPTAAATILLGPAIVSKIFTNPKLANLLINGAKGQSFENTGRTLGQIINKLVSDGDIEKDEGEALMDDFKSLKNERPEQQEPRAEIPPVQQQPIQTAPVQSAQMAAQTPAPQPTAAPAPVNTQVTNPMQYASLFPQDALGQAIAQKKVI